MIGRGPHKFLNLCPQILCYATAHGPINYGDELLNNYESHFDPVAQTQIERIQTETPVADIIGLHTGVSSSSFRPLSLSRRLNSKHHPP